MPSVPVTPHAPRISCVVPAYNEALNLPTLLERLRDALEALSPHWEIILIDDGSSDDTRSVLWPWREEPGLVVLHLSRNFGKEAALSAGIDIARGDVCFLMDADLQHPVEKMPEMLEAWYGGAEMVYLVRENRDDEDWVKRAGSQWLYRLLNWSSPVQIPPDAGDFRLLDRKVVDALRQLPERNRFMKGLYAWVGFRTQALSYTPPPRAMGQSQFSMRRLMGLALTGLTSFSTLPLRFWSVTGFLIAVMALGYGAFVAINRLLDNDPVPGWATIVVGLMFFSGVQLISIGVLGEYMGRVYEEVKQRPRYIVSEYSDNSSLADLKGNDVPDRDVS